MTPLWLEAQESPPWSLRLYAQASVPPAVVGALIALLYLIVVVAYFSATAGHEGFMPQGERLAGRHFWQVSGWWTLILNGVLIGFAPTTMAYTLRSVEQDVRDLSPSLGGELEAHVRTVARLNPRTLRGVGLAVLVAMIAFTFLDPGLWRDRARPEVTDPFFVWFLGQQVLLGWLWSRAVVADVSTARSFARLAGEIRQVDLLDPRPLSVFARRGVRSVLYWMLSLALFSLFWLAPNAGESNLIPFVLLIGLAGGNLIVLLGGARRRIRVEKDEQLRRLRDAIREDQRALLGGGAGEREAAARLPALFAAESRIASVGELAFDANTLVRFGLYVTLGVGSWVGGALIERLLGAALD